MGVYKRSTLSADRVVAVLAPTKLADRRVCAISISSLQACRLTATLAGAINNGGFAWVSTTCVGAAGSGRCVKAWTLP